MFGKVIVLCAPSGSGKTTLAKHLLSQKKFNLKFSISATTRQIRENEKDGIDYHFLSLDDFKAKIDSKDFIEFEKVYQDIYYGTLKSEIDSLIKKYNIIFDVDVIGALSLKKYFSSDALTIFINPPSLNELENRLIKRGLNSNNDLKERLEKAEKEIEMKSNFDYSITNDDLKKAKSDIFKKVDDFLIN
jgi:guanylate kinase